MCKYYTHNEHTTFDSDNAAVRWGVFTTDTLVLLPLETFKEWRHGGFQWHGVYAECNESRSAFISEVTWGCNIHGNYSRCAPIPCLHTTLNITPISDFIYHVNDKFFGSCPAHPNPLIRSIGNYSLADLHRHYKKYIHKRPKHILL